MLHVALFKGNNCVVTDAVRISSLILITHVCVLLLSARDLSGVDAFNDFA